MVAGTAGALSRIKRDPLGVAGGGGVERVCAGCGYDRWRERELDPATTVALFVQQVLHGNCPCSGVRHLGGCRFTAGAYCRARARPPPRVYQALLTEACDAAAPRTRGPGRLWRGRGTSHVGGSTFSTPDAEALREALGVPAAQGPGCVFPVAHLPVLFGASTGLLVGAVASPPYTGDVSAAPDLHPHLDPGDVPIGDGAEDKGSPKIRGRRR